MRAPFRHLLMAGAARINKGLDVVAELAERFAREGRDAPLLVQVSPKHVDRHGSREDAVVARLLAAGYRGLVADPKAPDRGEYAARFAGALVLAPYERAKFADGVSGVVLDALLHGAPCVATAGTWAGDVVERFDAGVAIRERTASQLAMAVDRILGKWDRYAARAAEASDALAGEHDPRRVAQLLAS
jgi:glycosyltransferase involved in cell wall biosynthesis